MELYLFMKSVICADFGPVPNCISFCFVRAKSQAPKLLTATASVRLTHLCNLNHMQCTRRGEKLADFICYFKILCIVGEWIFTQFFYWSQMNACIRFICLKFENSWKASAFATDYVIALQKLSLQKRYNFWLKVLDIVECKNESSSASGKSFFCTNADSFYALHKAEHLLSLAQEGKALAFIGTGWQVCSFWKPTASYNCSLHLPLFVFPLITTDQSLHLFVFV